MKEKISIELIKKARANDKQALEEILKACEYIAIAEANKFEVDKTEKEDLKQIARYSIFISIYRYDESYGASFETFATICAHNKILDYIRTLPPIGPSIDDDKNPIEDYLMSLPPIPNDPIFEILKKLFTPEEFNILLLWSYDYSYDEIEEDLKVKHTKIANTITKLKRYKDKIKEELDL